MSGLEAGQRASEVADVADAALRWIEAHPGLARSDEAALFRGYRRQARRLARASTRPAGVAVFGASQAGKSYLVSSLATSKGRPLSVDYGGTTLNFLSDMNPEGGNESTGLVSRFTTAPIPAPSATPIPVRLLSCVDIIKIVANTFLSDFKLDDLEIPGSEKVDQLLAEVPRDGAGIFDIDDVEELRDYFSTYFKRDALVSSLGGAYWLQLAELMGSLSLSSSVRAFSLLWGRTPALTVLATKLLGALIELGSSDTAFCALDALKPRETSVLNVSCLFGLGAGAGSTVRVTTSAGRFGTVDRSVLAAIIAEITVPLAGAPWPLFERADLLDFPGARTREENPNVEAFLSDPTKLGHAYLRGKVEFLFQRYQADREVTAMLLCIGDSVQNVQALPGMVSRWVDETVGRNASTRASLRNPLFLILSKFDRQFELKAGADPRSDESWTSRMKASLTEFLKGCNWLTEWTPGRPFDNVFWLRSTAVGFDVVFDYEDARGSRREVGIAPRAMTMVAQRQAAYLGNDLVRRHVADPARAWDEVMRPGDGGVEYLAEKLDPVCDRSAKVAQIMPELQRLTASMAVALRPHYRSGDIHVERRKAREAAVALARPLTQCAAAPVQMFGPLLRALTVSRDMMVEVWRSMQFRVETPIGKASDASDLFGQMFGDLSSNGLEGDNAQAGEAPLDGHDQFAAAAVNAWIRLMHTVAADDDMRARFRLPAEQATALVAGLSTLAERLSIREHLSTALRVACAHQSRITLSGEKQALIAAGKLGEFVAFLGYYDVPESLRPVSLDDRQRRVFASRPALNGPLALSDARSAYSELYFKDWISALVIRFEENAGVASDGFDEGANQALGAILSRLQAP